MKTVIQMVVTLAFIGILSGGLLAEIAGWAEPKIEMNKKKATEEAIFIVQPEAKKYEAVTSVKFEAYKVMNENDEMIGYALPYEGNGFQGKIRLMVGLSTDLNKVVGLQVLDQVETPGLGAKVVEEDFTKQFNGLSANPQVECIKGAAPSNPNEIEAITGATISSKAVTTIINSGLEALRAAENPGGAK